MYRRSNAIRLTAILFTLILTRLSASEITWREQFDAGLLQEELHQDLKRAIEHYQVNVHAFDQQRNIIALSLYRLAECYRKLGQVDRALPLYHRLVRNFSDLESLSLMAQRFVPDSNPAPSVPNTTPKKDPSLLLQNLVNASPLQIMVTLSQEASDMAATKLLERFYESESKLATMKIDFGSSHPAIQSEQANHESILRQMARHAEFAMKSIAEQARQSLSASPALPRQTATRLDDHPETLRALIHELEQMHPEDAFSTLIGETNVRIDRSLADEIASDRTELTRAKSRYKSTHPRVLATQEHLAANLGAVQSEVNKGLALLKAKLRILEKAITPPTSKLGSTNDTTKASQPNRKQNSSVAVPVE